MRSEAESWPTEPTTTPSLLLLGKWKTPPFGKVASISFHLDMSSELEYEKSVSYLL